MNPSDEAYKLAASFYLSSTHDDWTGDRLRKAILADINGDDKQALADQQELVVWEPIERHICGNCSMDDPNEELNDLIENLAIAFMQFAEKHIPNPIRKVVVEHNIRPLNNSGITYPVKIIPAKDFGSDFNKYVGLTLTHEEGMTGDGTSVSYSQTFLRTRKSDEELLNEFN